MTTADVLVAVRYRVNPGKTWTAYQGAPDGLSWEQYCEAHGQTATASEPVKQGTETPQLYAHLRPINRGVDHRRPSRIGDAPRLTHTVMPQALTVTGEE